MKRILAALLCLVALFTLCACSGGGSPAETQAVRVGIIQFADHPSLDNCREGFLEGMEKAGYKEGENVTYDYQNAQADMANCNTICQKFVADGCDLIVAIATPAAQAAYNAAKDKEIPVIYSAVSTAVESGLADTLDKPGRKATGTSDILPVDKQIALIQQLVPGAKTLGVLYNAGEVNSQVQVKMLEEAARAAGYTLVSATVATSNDVPLALDSVLSKCDVLVNVLDNTVVNAMKLLVGKCEQKRIPIIGSEEEQVSNGALASDGIDYIVLGNQTGAMAAEVLGGADPAEMAVQVFDAEAENIFINETVAQKLGIEVPADLRNRANLVK